ncbi:Ig-like domain-containing protein [Salinisphaera sp.]|uniref:Ig-like domain-containing protein n=1 Tax=Salinisphaera sp. TaxID=1914330 RepID=UPI0025DA7FCA|nr:Ig-like domain-containing protein [Salinisphaera sp.]
MPGIGFAKRVVGGRLCVALLLGLSVAGCGGSGGGSDDGGGSGSSSTSPSTAGGATARSDAETLHSVMPRGLAFTYPYNGQTDVALNSQLVVKFASDLPDASRDSLELRDAAGNRIGPALTVVRDDNQPRILRIETQGPLKPDTQYRVVATKRLDGGWQDGGYTGFNPGNVLYGFTTRPDGSRPAAGGFKVQEVTPGEYNAQLETTSVFVGFNPIRVVLSEPVDPATVTAESFTVRGPSGAITRANVTALGRYIVFDPVDDLTGGNYEIRWTSDIRSVFGNALARGSVNRRVRAVGGGILDNPAYNTLDTNLVISPTAADPANLPDNVLNGRPVNAVSLGSQLVGRNLLPVVSANDVTDPDYRGIQNVLRATIALPTLDGLDSSIPGTIRAGQSFKTTGLRLALGGEVPTPIDPSGPIDVNFISDVNVSIMGNEFPNIETPIAVRLRFDVALGSLLKAAASQPGTTAFQEYARSVLANGVINQTVLNVQAAGLAIPQLDGDIDIATVGSFPITVNRTDEANVDFELTLALKLLTNNPLFPRDQVVPDEVPPRLIARSPSACLYAFGNAGFATAGPLAATSFDENGCVGIAGASAINSFPVADSPALLLDSPVQPRSVNAESVALYGEGRQIAANYRTEGFSIVIDPVEPLEPATEYEIRLNDGTDRVRDFADNALTLDSGSIRFTTAPRVNTDPAPAYVATLTPGVPCALTGGNAPGTSGRCVGDNGSELGVFVFPANKAIEAGFSKPVRRDSVVLADGCLAGAGPSASSAATVALQRMSEAGQCLGVVDAALAFAEGDAELVNGFSVRPTQVLTLGSYYALVICGSGENCRSTVVDADGYALNTDPLTGSGSSTASAAEDAAGGPAIVMPFEATTASEDYYATFATLPAADSNGNGQFDAGEIGQPGNRAQILLTSLGIPISATQTEDRFDAYLSQGRPVIIGPAVGSCTDALANVVDDNRASLASASNCVPVALPPGGFTDLTGLRLGTPQLLSIVGNAIEQLIDELGLVDDQGRVQSMAQLQATRTPAEMEDIVDRLSAAVAGVLEGDMADGSLELESMFNPRGRLLDLLPNGSVLEQDFRDLFDNLDIGRSLADLLGDTGDAIEDSTLVREIVDLVLEDVFGIPNAELQTGRILLRYAPLPGTGRIRAQTGYIVERCQGTIDGERYDYAPCFAAALQLTANAPDGQGVALEQQTIDLNVFGPVSFQQNGRLVISVINANAFELAATALNLLPAKARVDTGRLNFQLAGPSIHGGSVFPTR